MGVLSGGSAWEREFRAVWSREQRFLRQYAERRESPVDRKAAEIVPEKLIETLRKAFAKAQGLVFDKGSGFICQVSGEDRRLQTYQVQAYAAGLREDRKRLRAFSRTAGRAGWGSAAFSGTVGMGMGLLGIALPDVPLFAAVLLKSVYETAASFGFSCREETERIYALRIIEAALSYGGELEARSRELDGYAQTGVWQTPADLETQISETARKLSEVMLYGKALQSVPVAGAIGGLGDAVCLRRVQRYAAIKYEKRFLLCRRQAAE